MPIDKTVPVAVTTQPTNRGVSVYLEGGLIGYIESVGEDGWLAKTETGEAWRFKTSLLEAAQTLAKRTGRVVDRVED